MTEIEYTVWVYRHDKGRLEPHARPFRSLGQALDRATNLAQETDVLDVVTILAQRVMRLPWEQDIPTDEMWALT